MRGAVALLVLGCGAPSDGMDAPAAGDDTDVTAVDTDAAVEEVSPCSDAPAPSLALGVGHDGFVEVVDGDVVALETYGQGGRHVPLSLRVAHTPRFVGLDVTVTRITDGQVLSIDASGASTGTARYGLDVAPDGTDEACVEAGGRTGLPARLSGAVLGPDAVDEGAWAVLCGDVVEVHTRLVWTRCVRLRGDDCLASEDVSLAEDRFEAVLGPSSLDDCDAPEGGLSARR